MLLAGIRAACPGVDVVLSDAQGAPADDEEAILFALIGWSSANGLPATAVAGTGARAPRILGSFTPGDGPLQLPGRWWTSLDRSPSRTPAAEPRVRSADEALQDRDEFLERERPMAVFVLLRRRQLGSGA